MMEFLLKMLIISTILYFSPAKLTVAESQQSIHQPTQTRIQVYVRLDLLQPNNPGALTVLPPPKNSSFGGLTVVDNPIYDGPEPNSKELGRQQGYYYTFGNPETGLFWSMSYHFTDGPYKNSTLSLLGLGFPSHQVREIPIVGGSGIFHMARGSELSRTFEYRVGDNTTVPFVEFDLTVYH